MDKQWDVNRIDLSLAMTFANRLDELETKIVFSAEKKIYQEEIIFGKHLLNWAISAINETTSDRLWLVVLKTYSFLYRIGKRNDGLNPLIEDKQDVMTSLTAALRDWKEGVEQFIQKPATANDLKKIGSLSRYHGFSNSLLQHKEMKETCFALIFRENFPIDSLVKYIKTTTVVLKDAFFTMRIGLHHKFGIEMLKIIEKETNGSFKKDLKLFINGKQVSILNPKKIIQMNGGRKFTWEKIVELGQRARKFPAELEMFADLGLILFRPQGLEYPINENETARIDTTKGNYWDHKEFHPFLTASKERIEEMLDIVITDDKPSILSIEGSCTDPYYVNHAHGNTTVYLRRNDGRYQIIPCGKYAATFPQSMGELLSFVGDTVKAEFTYPDPNLMYSYRLRGIWRHAVTNQEAGNWLKICGRKLWHFQFADNNCSADFQRELENLYGKIEDGGIVPNFFRLPFLEARPTFPLNYIFDPISVLPTPVASFFMHGLHVVFGSKREYTRKVELETETVSLYDSEYAKKEILYVPGMLPYRILTGEIDGVVQFGYD